MAHFAKLDDNNKVIAVHVVVNDILNVDGIESEQTGIDFLTNLHQYPNWKQTSYNGSFRKNYAGIGDTYDPLRDAFIPVKPYESWILDEATCQWKCPIPIPEFDESNPIPWVWDESSFSWVDQTTIQTEAGFANG